MAAWKAKLSKDVLAILWFASGIFLGLSLFSFHSQDPSFNSLGSNTEVQNFCGYFGSFLADFFYQFWGISAWFGVLIAFFFSYQCFQDEKGKVSFSKALLGFFFILNISSLIGLYWPEFAIFEGMIPVSGVLGLAISKSLSAAFNLIGVGVLLWSSLLILGLLLTETTLKKLFTGPKDALKAIDAKRKEGLPKISFSWHIPKWQPRFKKTSLERKEEGQEQVVLTKENFPLAENREISQQQMPLRKKKIMLKKKVQRKVENWELPNIKVLEDPPESAKKIDSSELKNKTNLLEDKLEQFSVRGKVTGVLPGPAVTLFEFKPNADVKISRITDLADDLSLALSSESVRIIAPIPGRDVVGIETSNSIRETVYLKEILADDEFWSDEIKLPLALGKRANGSPQIVDLRKMPHLMVAGSTGSGKSVFVVSVLTGLLFKHSPKTLRLIVVDPKQVDLAAFHKVPHLLMPPICESKKAVTALKWAIKEMEKRYRSMSQFGARNIEEFNQKVLKLNEEELEKHESANEELLEQGRIFEAYHYTQQPYIVVVVEEFGDLMTVDKSNVEQTVVRLAQMARASGIHLILAMQSPRKDVVTGLIKTNIPGRISFKVASKMDSRIILDESGAERLLARGDMLFLAPGVVKPQRHHGPWLTEGEIQKVMDSWADQAEPIFDEKAMQMLDGSGGGYGLESDFSTDSEEEEFDERYDEIVDWVSTQKGVSASLLQRKFRLGYPRAARMIEILEREGVVGPANGSKPRQVLAQAMPDQP